MALDTLLLLLLGLAWLLPLGSFVVILLVGPKLGRGGRHSGLVALGAMAGSLALSAVALVAWLWEHPPGAGREHGGPMIAPLAGDWYTLAECGTLRLSIGYYIDALTVTMFFMVTLVATCIHVYSLGYMHEELDEVTDHEVVLAGGQTLVRPGRFPRFFQYLSLFSFCMLGLVLAGNLAMVFVFWELVGICSYLLIGFYVERPSATRAANKAFIVNRVGDFGMLVGLMALWGSLGTLSFGDVRGPDGALRPGLFSQVRPAAYAHRLVVPEGMVLLAARGPIDRIGREASHPAAAQHAVAQAVPRWREQGIGYWLLVVAGLGVFCGCVGKSAQVPLHVWLPDAMEGPTPVSALIHAATMVAAGVYLVGRCYALLTPEVLLVIAYVGCATLFIAATIALTLPLLSRMGAAFISRST